MNLPSFESFFELIKKLSLSIGVIILKPKQIWTKLDLVVFCFGYYNAVACFYSFFCYTYQTFQIIRNELYFFLIGEVPSLFWVITQCLNMFILIYNYDDIMNLAKQFEDLYAIEWSDTSERSIFIRQLKRNKKQIIAYQIFFLGINIVFSVTPLITTAITYFTTGTFEPVFIFPNILYPFDKVKFYWITFIIEFILARVSTLVTIAIDVLVLVFIIQLTYHFECLGVEIQLMQGQPKQSDKKILKNLLKIHQSLLE